MQEVLPGVHHWTTIHPRLGIEVSSYWLEEGGVAIDPLVPPDVGLAWFGERATPPTAVFLSNRHHYRDSGRFAAEFGCTVMCNAEGLHEFSPNAGVQGFRPGDELPGGVLACAVGAICPDESALYLSGRRALVIADGVVRGASHGQPGPIGFVPDALMDEPQRTKEGLLAAYARLCEELDFEHVLLAHGGPLIGDGRAQLEEFLAAGGRTAFEL